jgi:hypothetical protein
LTEVEEWYKSRTVKEDVLRIAVKNLEGKKKGRRCGFLNP